MSQARPKTIQAVLKSADKDLVDTVCECCLNVLKGNVPLTPPQKRKLQRHKLKIRRLATKRTSQKQKKALMQKGGNFIKDLLLPIVSTIGSLLL
jgi:hypothetical protein